MESERDARVRSRIDDEFDLGEKYRGDSALDDCMRIFSIYRKLRCP